MFPFHFVLRTDSRTSSQPAPSLQTCQNCKSMSLTIILVYQIMGPVQWRHRLHKTSLQAPSFCGCSRWQNKIAFINHQWACLGKVPTVHTKTALWKMQVHHFPSSVELFQVIKAISFQVQNFQKRKITGVEQLIQPVLRNNQWTCSGIISRSLVAWPEIISRSLVAWSEIISRSLVTWCEIISRSLVAWSEIILRSLVTWSEIILRSLVT